MGKDWLTIDYIGTFGQKLTTAFRPLVTAVEWIPACLFRYVCLISRPVHQLVRVVEQIETIKQSLPEKPT